MAQDDTRPARAVIFDGDDTLWITEPLYDAARSAARDIVVSSGGDGDQWEALQRTIDVENVSLLGHTAERFPKSCVQAYERTCLASGSVPDPKIVTRIRDAARAVFANDPPRVPGAQAVLVQLTERGTRLALLTKGDLRVQEQRVARSGLKDFFMVIRYVEHKAASDVHAILTDLRVAPAHAWMVGNSVRSDILPALEAGIRAIWVPAHVWEYERAHDHLVDDRVLIASRITEIPELIASADGA